MSKEDYNIKIVTENHLSVKSKKLQGFVLSNQMANSKNRRQKFSSKLCYIRLQRPSDSKNRQSRTTFLN